MASILRAVGVLPDVPDRPAKRLTLTLILRREGGRDVVKKEPIRVVVEEPQRVAVFVHQVRSARRHPPHKHAALVQIAIDYQDGTQTVFGILPGHDPGAYELMVGGDFYSLPRRQFLQAVRDLGIDPSTIPLGDDGSG